MAFIANSDASNIADDGNWVKWRRGGRARTASRRASDALIRPTPGSWRWMSCWRKDRPEAKRPNTAAWAAFDVYASDALPEAALGLRYAGSRSRRQQRCTGLREQCALVAVGEQTVVADAVEAARQHMEREATQEFGGFELHHLTSVAARVVLVAEAHRIGSCGQQPIVGDRRAMRIAAQVLEHL